MSVPHSTPEFIKFVVNEKVEKVFNGVRQFRISLEDEATRKFSTSFINVNASLFDSCTVGCEITFALALAGETEGEEKL